MLVWVIYQFSHQTPRRKIARQEFDQISPGQEDAAAEDDRGRDGPDGVIEGVETGGGEHEPADHGQIGEGEDGEGDARSLAGPHEEGGDGLHGLFVLARVTVGLVKTQLGVVGRAQGVGIFGLVLLVVGLVDPFEGIHEHVIERGGDVAH